MVLLALALLEAAARIAVVDFGPEPAGAAARAAIERALGPIEAGDAELREALFGIGWPERTRAAGEAAFAEGKAAFGALHCDQAEKSLNEAERQLGQLPISETRAAIAEIEKYREACARERRDEPAAAAYHALREALRVGEVADGGSGASGGARIDVQLDPDPSDAAIFLDGREVGRGPHPLAPGLHLADIEKPGYRKWHRTLEVQPPGPMRTAVVLSPAPAEPHASVRASVRSMRGGEPDKHLSLFADIAVRASADRVLLVDVRGEEIRAQVFDADLGVLEGQLWKGRTAQGSVPGLAGFASGKNGAKLGPHAPAAAPPPRRKKPIAEDLWSHWYTWAIAGALGGLAALLVVSASSSDDVLTIKATH